MCKALIDNEAAQSVQQRGLLCKRGNEAVLPLHLQNLLQGRLEHGPGKHQQYLY